LFHIEIIYIIEINDGCKDYSIINNEYYVYLI